MAFPPLRRRSGSPETPSADNQTTPNRLDGGEEDARDAHDLRHDFDALTSRYQRTIYNTVFRLIGDPEEASDLTQETFISAYRASAQFRGESRVSTWLYRIAVNHCKNRFKQRDRQKEHESFSLDDSFGSPWSERETDASESRLLADWSQSPEGVLQQKELRAMIASAVDALPTDYKLVLVLREMNGLNYNEIVEATGLTMETVKTRLSRARGMIRRRIEPYYRMG